MALRRDQRSRLRKLLWDRQGGLCCYCERSMAVSFGSKKTEAKRLGIFIREVADRRATLEHLKRRAEGGGNGKDNLALACNSCNRERGETDWLTFKTLKAG